MLHINHFLSLVSDKGDDSYASMPRGGYPQQQQPPPQQRYPDMRSKSTSNLDRSAEPDRLPPQQHAGMFS